MSNASPITSLGGILEGFLSHEKNKIADFEIKHGKIPHGPTIGDIYEGLTAELLSRAIPKELNLRIADGHVTGKDGSKSGQIDCMLVKGAGSTIPNTSSEIIPIENVLAVLEVKKTLYGGHFADILDHFNQVMLLEPNFSEPIPAEDILRTFSQITGIQLENRSEVATQEFHHQLIYHSLVSEFVRPVRIAIGYDGFKTESGLRKSFVDLMDKKSGSHWIPPTSWPDLLISGDFSMVKLNGRPYVVPSQDGYWKLFATTRTKPIQLLLELIYTRISKDVYMVDFWGEDLEQEVLNPFLEAKAIDLGDKQGWEYKYLKLNENKLAKKPVTNSWAPYFPGKEEAIVFHMLTSSPDGLKISEIEKGVGDVVGQLVQKLTQTGLVALREDRLFLTTTELRIGFLGDGRCFVGEDNTGRLSRWALKEMERIKKQQKKSD